ncbi:MAG: hypothetical protein BWY50_02072 [Spirochaetes bacterium ADurb.Bin315]|nr:MAG: hypothetical protein BWY50_02072 [Spirochaetes bacterium ADurb.Bin315]
MTIFAFVQDFLSKVLHDIPALVFTEKLDEIQKRKEVLRTLSLDGKHPVDIVGNHRVLFAIPDMPLAHVPSLYLLLIIQMFDQTVKCLKVGYCEGGS